MKNQLINDQDYNLWILLHETSEMIGKARHNELDKYNIKIRQAAVLFAVKVIETSGEYATPGKISKWLLREPNTISRILNRMEKEGLINKIRNSINRNEIEITLTKKGEQAYIQSLKRKTIQETMSCLSIEERQQMRSSLRKLRDKAASNLNEARNNQSFASDKLIQLL
jgi:DNA-binding MarR family transcriptional regulator